MLTARSIRSMTPACSRLPAMLAWAMVGLSGCVQPGGSGHSSVETALESSPLTESSAASVDTALTKPRWDFEFGGRSSILATVDGIAIDRQRVVAMLLETHGVALIEKLAVLELADLRASAAGIVVTQIDIDAEYDRALRRAAVSLGFEDRRDTLSDVNRGRAQQWLDEYLAERNVSRSEFAAVVRLNACLRALAEDDLSISEQALRTEFDRLQGTRVEVRHIQVATLAEADRIAERLARGESFAALARGYSANIQSAATGGLLPAFTALDPDVPRLLRETAFALEPGESSVPIRIDPWYHLLRCERRMQAEPGSFEDAREELERRLSDRLVEPRMAELYRELLDGADIRINDRLLGEAFRRRRR